MGKQVISIAIQKLGDFIAKTLSSYVTVEVVLLNKVRSNAEWLRNELGYMLSFLQDVKEEGEDVEQAGKHAVFQHWKADVHRIAEDTTSVLQEITLKMNKDSKKGCLVQLYACIRSSRAEIFDINEQIESLKARVEEVSRKRETYGIRNPGSGSTRKNKEQIPVTPVPNKSVKPEASFPEKQVELTSFPEKFASALGQEQQGTSDNLPHNDSTDAEHAQVSLPHNCEDILRHADSPVDRTSSDKLYEQLRAGVYLNGKKKKYWVEEESERNCFTLFARDLSVTWGHDERYWHWPVLTESSDESVTGAELLDVCWLEVHGRFEMGNLTPETVYEVVFIVKLKDSAYGWVVPINLRLTLPDGTRHERRESLNEKPREEWIEIQGGEFETSSDKVGQLEISLYEYEVLNWKNGLIIKGVSFRPKAF